MPSQNMSFEIFHEPFPRYTRYCREVCLQRAPVTPHIAISRRVPHAT